MSIFQIYPKTRFKLFVIPPLLNMIETELVLYLEIYISQNFFLLDY